MGRTEQTNRGRATSRSRYSRREFIAASTSLVGSLAYVRPGAARSSAFAPEIPEATDIVVLGGGTAGAIVAAAAASRSSADVLLLEAGPDYGALDNDGWPADLLDASETATSHDWGFKGRAHPAQSEAISFGRARVIGGCSSHNHCFVAIGDPSDYDEWEKLGNPGWNWASVQPAFDRAKHALRVRIPRNDELTPYENMFLDRANESGIPRLRDLNDPEHKVGAAGVPVNVSHGVRWNTSFAYLDPVRRQQNLTIAGDTLVDRIRVRHGRVVGVETIIQGRSRFIEAGRVVISAGAYGSPLVLMRSGIGNADELRRLGIDPVLDLRAVGRHLADHPILAISFRGSRKLDRHMIGFQSEHWTMNGQALARARSGLARDTFDLHLITTYGRGRGEPDGRYHLLVSVVASRSVGAIHLASSDPEASPRIEHAYLSDPEEYDVTAMADGVELAREIMSGLQNAGWLLDEVSPGPKVSTRAQLTQWIKSVVGPYDHAAGSCRMGPSNDRDAVVDSAGKVHGIDGLYVCDASIFPRIMRANTNLPTAMVGERIAAGLFTPR